MSGQMRQSKRHHYVPKAYLKAFCDKKGRLLVYRKDASPNALYVTPDNTQFQGYYYSQPTPDGGRDNNSLEQLFSEVESKWPATLAVLHSKGPANERIAHLCEFMALQRVRVPAARDMAEAALARSVKDTTTVMLSNGSIPPPPASLSDFPNGVEVSIDPHQSIHAMAAMMQGMSALLSKLGLAVIHNLTATPFLTSDNPVIWFDPSRPFDEQRPYTVDPNGPISLAFPISPTVAIIGSREYSAHYARHGLLHSDVGDEDWVISINEQICRFAYEAVIASELGQEKLIAKYASTSPVHEAMALNVTSGAASLHRFAFGKRKNKPKW
jgi:hypothetical protein